MDVAAAAKEKENDPVKILYTFLDDRLALGEVPRLFDVWEFVQNNRLSLTKKEMKKAVRLHPSFMYNMSQERFKRRANLQRPIIMRSLGHLHMDLGYYSVVREYSTPKTYQYGFLIAKDVVSRYTYVQLMNGKKTAKNLERVLKRLLAQHEADHPDYKIKSVSFDKEPGIMSDLVQRFFKENGIAFHAFQFSNTKAKIAEQAIRLLRTDMARLMRFDKSKRWWSELQNVVKNLNSKPILVNGKNTGYTPKSITSFNVSDFLEKVQKADPSSYFSQFNVITPIVKYKFKVGDLVRPKTIAVSSQALGVKRSQTNLEPDLFVVKKQIPFVARKRIVVPAYKCEHLQTSKVEIFSEEDIALSTFDQND
jgi:hypothetical protein